MTFAQRLRSLPLSQRAEIKRYLRRFKCQQCKRKRLCAYDILTDSMICSPECRALFAAEMERRFGHPRTEVKNLTDMSRI